jgi:hypothetical protein
MLSIKNMFDTEMNFIRITFETLNIDLDILNIYLNEKDIQIIPLKRRVKKLSALKIVFPGSI